MAEARVYINGGKDLFPVRINGTKPTFQLRTDTIRAMARSELDPLQLDLVEIAATVFAADGSTARGGATRPTMGRAWRRSFEFTIPVRKPEFWADPDVIELLIDAVGFLTEDHVSFSFEKKPVQHEAEPFLDFDPNNASFQADEVILFSGGLDSFAGALEALATTPGKVILLTHRSAQKAIPRQIELGQYLAGRFPNRVLHINVLARRKGQEASDSSQRSRSFLFAALAEIVAHAFGAKRVSFYENGVISHNLPISPQVVGTMATRTTHPLSLRKLNTLMQTLGEGYSPIENRFQWLTKRDVIERIAQHGGAAQIPRTVSCTSIREQTTLHTHCGVCSQCLDRRFAILAAGLEAHDFDTDYGTDVLFAPRETIHSRTMAVEWTRHALKMAQIDTRELMKQFGLELSRIAQGHPDQDTAATLNQCHAMHQRHGTNVEIVLTKVLHEHAKDILHGKLPESSLVAMFLRTGLEEKLEVPLWQSDQQYHVPSIPIVEEFDLAPDPEAPLQVQFLEEGGLPIISVLGLCRLKGRPAKVPYELKREFLSDKSFGLSAEEHHCVSSGDLSTRLSMSKDTVRQSAFECRKLLQESYIDLFGHEPDRDLLLQHFKAKGYRLDPEIVVVEGIDSQEQ